MDKDFKELFADLIKHEGGYSNYPEDVGRETIFGISRVYHPNVPIWSIVDKLKDTIPMFHSPFLNQYEKSKYWRRLTEKCTATPEFLKEAEKFIYEKQYLKFKIPELNSKGKKAFTFDFAFNSGKAIKVIQEALGLKADNIIGKNTIQKINEMDEKEYIQKCCQARKDYLQSLIKKDPALKIFLKGWYTRVNFYLDKYGGGVQ